MKGICLIQLNVNNNQLHYLANVIKCFTQTMEMQNFVSFNDLHVIIKYNDKWRFTNEITYLCNKLHKQVNTIIDDKVLVEASACLGERMHHMPCHWYHSLCNGGLIF